MFRESTLGARVAHAGVKARAKPRRDDIQGLRAVGALLVAVFHIWMGRVSGGVDVFFVVSGFLLLGSLAREAEGGRVDLRRFFLRLVQRLAPASLFVLAAILLTAPWWVAKSRWDAAAEQIGASALYFENWMLAFKSVNYLAREQVASPVQHYWAMSVQVQAMAFYALAFAFFTALIGRTTLKRGGGGGAFWEDASYFPSATRFSRPRVTSPSPISTRSRGCGSSRWAV